MAYKGRKINELPVDSGVEKLLGTDVNGEVKLIEKEDLGGGTETSYVHVAEIDGHWTADKTYAEIKASFDDGKPVTAIVEFEASIMQLPFNAIADGVIMATHTIVGSADQSAVFAACVEITSEDRVYWLFDDITGDIDELETESKSDLVSAINEVNEKASRSQREYLDNAVIVKDLVKMEPVSGHDDLIEGEVLIPFTLSMDATYDVRINVISHHRDYPGTSTYEGMIPEVYADYYYYVGAPKTGEGEYDFSFTSDLPFALIEGHQYGEAKFIFKKSELYPIGEDDDGNVVYDPGFALNVTLTASRFEKPKTLSVSDEYGTRSNLRLYSQVDEIEIVHTDYFSGRITTNAAYRGNVKEVYSNHERIDSARYGSTVSFATEKLESSIAIDNRICYSANFIQIREVGIRPVNNEDTIPQGKIGVEKTQNFQTMEWNGDSTGRETIKAISPGDDIVAILTKVSDETFDLRKLMYKITFNDGEVVEYRNEDDSDLSASGEILWPAHGRTAVVSVTRPGWYTVVGDGGVLVYAPVGSIGTYILRIDDYPYVTKIEPLSEVSTIDAKFIPNPKSIAIMRSQMTSSDPYEFELTQEQFDIISSNTEIIVDASDLDIGNIRCFVAADSNGYTYSGASLIPYGGSIGIAYIQLASFLADSRTMSLFVRFQDIDDPGSDMATESYVDSKTGDLTELDTSDKTQLVAAINELVARVAALEGGT